MKKHFIYLTTAILAISMIFIACKKDDDFENTTWIGSFSQSGGGDDEDYWTANVTMKFHFINGNTVTWDCENIYFTNSHGTESGSWTETGTYTKNGSTVTMMIDGLTLTGEIDKKNMVVPMEWNEENVTVTFTKQ